MRFILIILLSGCSATFHIKRARAKDPGLFEVKKEITIDTVWVTVKKVDTLFKYKMDTMFITKDSVKIKYYYSYQDSLVYISADCPDCPSVNKVEKTKEFIFINPTIWEKLRWGFYGAVILGIGLFVMRFFNML